MNNPTTTPTQWEYKCIFCDRSFNSGRALGGHQNAHRFEPRETKRTHHVRVPKQDRPPMVPHKNFWPPPNPRNHSSQGYDDPMTMQQWGLPFPPRVAVADHRREHEWDILVARAGQGMRADGPARKGPYLNARTGADGVEQVDLDLKL